MNRRTIWRTGVVLVVWGVLAMAADPEPAIEAGGATEVAANAENVDATAVRDEPVPTYEYETAVIQAVEGIRAMAAKNPFCWIATPIYPHQVASWETRPVHYREVIRKAPIYEYDTYEALVPGASAGQLVKTQQRRIKGIKGYHDVKGLVHDPKGPIILDQRYPIYEKGTAALWRWGQLGANAMTVYALRAVGVPGGDGLLTPTTEGLATFVKAFDMPDNTWDLAWLTAAFAVLPGESYAELTERCASKLMDGQIAVGECAGLWGPVCVNSAVAAAVYKVLVTLSDEKTAVDQTVRAQMQAALRGVKVSKKVSKAEQEQIRLEKALLEIQREGSRVTQLGLRLFLAMGMVGVEAADGEQARVQGHPYLIHNQTLADMESTAMALFALRVAAEQKRLPSKTWRPTLEAAGRINASQVGIPAPRAAADVIRLAARAVSSSRLPDGRWHEANRHQPVGDFAWLKAMPQVKGRLAALDSPTTAVTTLRGLAAFNNAAFFQRMASVPVPYDNDVFMTIVDEALIWTTPVKGEPEARANTERLIALGMLSAIAPGAPREQPADGWRRAARMVLEQQNKKTGLWGHPTRYILWISTGLWARKTGLPELGAVQMADYYPQSHVAPTLTQPRVIANHYAIPEWTLSTAGALLFLSDGLEDAWSCPTDGVVYEPPEPPPTP